MLRALESGFKTISLNLFMWTSYLLFVVSYLFVGRWGVGWGALPQWLSLRIHLPRPCLKKPFIICHLCPNLGFSQTASSAVLEPPFYSLPAFNSLLLTHTSSLSLLHSPDLLMTGSFLSFWFQADHTSKAASCSLLEYKAIVILNFKTSCYLIFSC